MVYTMTFLLLNKETAFFLKHFFFTIEQGVLLNRTLKAQTALIPLGNVKAIDKMHNKSLHLSLDSQDDIFAFFSPTALYCGVGTIGFRMLSESQGPLVCQGVYYNCHTNTILFFEQG